MPGKRVFLTAVASGIPMLLLIGCVLWVLTTWSPR